ncbi:MAG: MMPL family transporter [Flavobacteriales bacterium]|nr:MMPL family transporter [Flavobacteriales bacterium]
MIVLALVTSFMAMQVPKMQMSYKFDTLLPKNDPDQIFYEKFKKDFSEDGNVIVVGVKGEEFWEYRNFAAWYDLGNELKEIDGIDSIFSVTHLYNIEKNEEEKIFEFKPLIERRPANQYEVDSIRSKINSLPFYENLLYSDSTFATLMMVFVDAEQFNSEQRIEVVKDFLEEANSFNERHMTIHYSGLPYIRTVTTALVKEELNFFLMLAAIVTGLILYFFFRSLRIVFFCLFVVGCGVVSAMGTLALFEYKLTMLMGLIPPLIIVIGIPNCIFLLNKYHQEYILHGNRIRALQRVIVKVGNATFMTNCTTALGFFTFIFTKSDLLREFGVVASINIIWVFVLALCIIPIIFSYLPKPKERHTKHLEKRWVETVVSWLLKVVKDHRKMIYVITGVILLAGFYGISKIQATGNIVGDLPQDEQVVQDLRFFESNFNGVMPFEVLIDTKKKGMATKDRTLKKIEKLQKVLSEHEELSKSLSIVDAVKFAKQSFYNGSPSKYSLIKGNEKSFIAPYLDINTEGRGVADLFLDSARQITRVSAQVADIGTLEMKKLIREEIQPQIDEIFPSDQYDVHLTGTSVLYLKGTRYLVENLFISLLIAISVIACLMAILFRSIPMALISLVPNLIPLIFTAAIMGYFGIPIKPSTILVFSIVFGISIDDTIHYLAKYRQELKVQGWNLKQAILNAIEETGISMIYTSVILFFGFGMFAASQFGGTQALGILSSVTLLVAMLANLVLLPSILMSWQKLIDYRSLKEPLLQILDEEEDIDLDNLKINKN